MLQGHWEIKYGDVVTYKYCYWKYFFLFYNVSYYDFSKSIEHPTTEIKHSDNTWIFSQVEASFLSFRYILECFLNE